jgi:hypothetical protein
MFKIFFDYYCFLIRGTYTQENGGLMPLYLNLMDVAAPEGTPPRRFGCTRTMKMVLSTMDPLLRASMRHGRQGIF